MSMCNKNAEIVESNYIFNVKKSFQWADMAETYVEWLRSYNLPEGVHEDLMKDALYALIYLCEEGFVRYTPSMSLNGCYRSGLYEGRLEDGRLIYEGVSYGRRPYVSYNDTFYLQDDILLVHLQAIEGLDLEKKKKEFLDWLDKFEDGEGRVKYCKEEWVGLFSAWLVHKNLARVIEMPGLPERYCDISIYKVTSYSFRFLGRDFQMFNEEDLEDEEIL